MQSDPAGLLANVWKELEKRFGSAAVITNALLDNLHLAANFKENEHDKLQRFADICADVESQIKNLPGLACLNFPNAIAPIVAQLPASLKAKWDKEVVAFAEKNGDQFPGFSNFKIVVEKQTKIKNHPNLTAGLPPQTQVPMNRPQRTGSNLNKKAFLTNASTAKAKMPKATKEQKNSETRFCHFHKREGHSLAECNVFSKKTLEEWKDFILKAGLCFKCLSTDHHAASCQVKINCSVCGDQRHIALLHKDQTVSETQALTSKCTTICSAEGGGLSCSKIVLVDVYAKNAPNSTKHVYAILDDQSNTSLISSELADQLSAKGPPEMYYLSTCSGERQEKFGRRVTNTIVRALNGYTSELPTLVECEGIPSDRRDIPTPEISKRFKHLSGLAKDIPALDDHAGIHLLIGRDAPELLKVREFRNGPPRGPMGPKTLARLDYLRASLPRDERWSKTREQKSDKDRRARPRVRFDAMSNAFNVKESFGDVFRTTEKDEETALLCEDKKFLEMMEASIHENSSGNWEMPLPSGAPPQTCRITGVRQRTACKG